MRKRTWSLVILLVSLSFLLIFAGEAPKYGGKVIYTMGTDAKTLLPPHINDSPSGEVARHIFEGLVEYDEKLNIKPLLAEKWEMSNDGLTYTFYLRKGVKFHDGTDFNAQAVKKTFDFIINGKLRRTNIYKKRIKEVEIVDDYTVRFHLKAPFSDFLNYMASTNADILSPKAIEKYGDDYGEFGKYPVGTGPFVFVEWKPGEKIVLKANENYWGGRPYLDEIEFRVTPEDVTRALQIQSGDAHITTRVPPVMYNALKKDPRVVIERVPETRVIFLGINTIKKPLDDIRVRRALNYAIDKEKICKVVLQGMAFPLKSPISELLPGHYPVGAYPYDPKKAKELLKEAGFDENHKLKLELATPKGRYLMDYQTALAIQGMLKEVGVEIDVRPMEWGEYINYLFAGRENAKYDIYLLGWSDTLASNVIDRLFSSTNVPPLGENIGFYSNPKVDELIEKISRAIDPKKKDEYLAEVQKIIMADAPWVFLHNVQELILYRKGLKGLIWHSSEFLDLRKAWWDK
ncbi:MAG: glutathione ABC transporter substrate-binding protein [Thermotogae bacterium]|nr:glutathione ABC transporter substrate-binding protein [Thermotogota bacterium]